MFGWAKNAVGLTDKHHGAAALHSVKAQTAETPYTVLKKEDEKWEIIDNTCVECKTFYITTDSGKLALVQIIYSNVLNVKKAGQIGVKVFSDDKAKPHVWHSDMVSDYQFVNDKYDFTSPKCSHKISEDGKTYTVKSTVNPACTVDLKFTQLAPSFMVGKDGTTYFGEDIKKPTGKMKHTFWPRAHVEGVIITKDGHMDMAGKAMFVHVVQGVKPHFAAARWNFAHFQSPTYSALSMEYITPPSYDNTVVSVGCVATDGKIIIANANSTATHVRAVTDPDTGLPEPKAVTYAWFGKSDEGKDVTAEIKADFQEQRLDRIDIMDEIPKFLRGVITGAMGARPFIYQWGPLVNITVNDGGNIKEEQGRLHCEATFIS
ncbi:hypothetical protein AMS68_004662 [Peltaster fructicola]|uniref:Survival factor 1 n=1 Tax=Peltaster fructicola TaxID=286661 RepID=A0A6H0XWV8_9PEZI|nr:hypothetical protein AMS68_004662 [Peltaster fructicola]